MPPASTAAFQSDGTRAASAAGQLWFAGCAHKQLCTREDGCANCSGHQGMRAECRLRHAQFHKLLLGMTGLKRSQHVVYKPLLDGKLIIPHSLWLFSGKAQQQALLLKTRPVGFSDGKCCLTAAAAVQSVGTSIASPSGPVRASLAWNAVCNMHQKSFQCAIPPIYSCCCRLPGPLHRCQKLSKQSHVHCEQLLLRWRSPSAPAAVLRRWA